MLKKCYKVLDNIRATAVVTLLGGIILLCIIQIILRYFTSASIKPFAWGDEVVRLTSIWTTFLAASIGVKESSHLSVDFFIEKFVPKHAIALVKRIAIIFVICVLGTLVWYGILRTKANIPAMMQNLPVSMAWFYAAIPVGCFFLLIDYTLIAIYGEHPFASKGSKKEKEEELNA